MERSDIERLRRSIRDIPDFPKKGIIFKDITPLLKDKELFSLSVEEMIKPFKDKEIDRVVAIEARGFILGGAIAQRLQCGIIPVRKKGKLPFTTHSVTYELEYGTDILEMHTDAIERGNRILLVDDLLATGGTAKSTSELVERCGGRIIGISFLIELTFLKGKEKLKGYSVHSVTQF